MYVREAKNRDEVWLLDHIEAMGLDDTAFRSRDYVIAMDEEGNRKAGFGRIRVHKAEEGREKTQTGRGERSEADVCELTSIGVLDGWRHQGVGAHIIERLVKHARDEAFEQVYALTDQPEFLAQFGFEALPEGDLPAQLQARLAEKREGVAPDAVPVVLDADAFEMPTDLRERFKDASEKAEPDAVDDDPSMAAEEFGIDPDTATYKYDTGG
jgi:N-acetylglutamate synthase-like GNAT family acetyltransferase